MIRRMLVASVLAVGFTGTGAVAPAQAAEACGVYLECETTYFSDSNHTTAVGGRYVTCNGSESRWGTVTAYREVLSWSC